MNALDSLVTLFSKLPGIGKKTAGRLSYHILESDPSYAISFASVLANLHESIKHCSVCGNWTENDPCAICTDMGRDRSVICVVERAQDIRVIDESGEFRGLFHVLGALIAPLDGVHPEDLPIGKLIERLRNDNVCEVILALNPTFEGDITARYIQAQLKDMKTSGGDALNVSRLASGLPVGGDLEYADRLTLARSFRSRIQF
ncbi:MAG: recombination mediator RecR [Termitinemataceae bacterium]|nr:MAG: recombination mediator RecR [Termitinemataceae bacterium]